MGGDWCWLDRLDGPARSGNAISSKRGWRPGWPMFQERLRATSNWRVRRAATLRPRTLASCRSSIGQGLGGALLTTTVERAWAIGAQRSWAHTCSLDHPNALPDYQARGFRVFHSVQTAQDLPARPPGPWPGAFPEAEEG
jgi:GNAT superfamily N-acetyltransferase